jgi:hypothetical protein
MGTSLDLIVRQGPAHDGIKVDYIGDHNYSKPEDIQELQSLLAGAGYTPKSGQTGLEDATKQFQIDNKLNLQEGKAGPETLAKLREVVAQKQAAGGPKLDNPAAQAFVDESVKTGVKTAPTTEQAAAPPPDGTTRVNAAAGSATAAAQVNQKLDQNNAKVGEARSVGTTQTMTIGPGGKTRLTMDPDTAAAIQKAGWTLNPATGELEGGRGANGAKNTIPLIGKASDPMSEVTLSRQPSGAVQMAWKYADGKDSGSTVLKLNEAGLKVPPGAAGDPQRIQQAIDNTNALARAGRIDPASAQQLNALFAQFRNQTPEQAAVMLHHMLAANQDPEFQAYAAQKLAELYGLSMQPN